MVDDECFFVVYNNFVKCTIVVPLVLFIHFSPMICIDS